MEEISQTEMEWKMTFLVQSYFFSSTFGNYLTNQPQKVLANNILVEKVEHGNVMENGIPDTHSVIFFASASALLVFANLFREIHVFA